MRSKLIVVLLCTLLFCFSVYGQNGAVERLLSTPVLKNAAIGISVKSIKSGESVAEYSSHVSMQPASLIKLFTTGLALEQQGPDYRYKTLVKYSGVIENAVLKGNILIEGSGDPCPDSRFFPDYKLAECLVAWIKDAGIKEIEGSVLITGEEDHSELPGSWVWEDISNYYAAQHFPFNYRDNAYWLEFKTGASGTPAELLSITPPIPQISIINEVLASEKPGDNAWIFGGPYAKNLYVRGYLPQNRKSFKIKGAMHSPATCFVQEVTNKLMAEGIEIKNKPVRELPDKEWNAFESPAL
ncbi:D-alanyl-D-alanine carboxypeptidase, partial [Porphyromonadaceae bacterium OttesenSCG-928-L07]|nr:D-alanyl-D-alanine carboxypeptidase [Porphyromonadaceae bacterium OttesenSCG-928-L07]